MMLRAFAAAICVLAIVGCGGKGAAPHGSPAKVEKAPVETEIARITLEPKATERLGIKTVPIELQTVERRRVLPAEILTPPGRTTIVSAQIPGTVQPPESGTIAVPGTTLQVGDAVLRLVPLLSPERYVPTPAERVQMANAQATLVAALTVAQGDVERGEAEVEAATIALQRAEQLFADRAGPQRAVDDGKAALAVAKATFEAAMQRSTQLEKLVADLSSSGQSPEAGAESLVIRSP